MRVVQASRWEWTVAGLGLVLIALLFAPWYGFENAGWTAYAPGNHVIPPNASGWETGTVTSIVVAAFGMGCVAQAVVLRGVRGPATGLTWNVAIEWASIVVVVWIAIRAIWPPAQVGIGGQFSEWGAWASLAVAVAVMIVNWLGMRDERTSRPRNREVPVRPIPPAA